MLVALALLALISALLVEALRGAVRAHGQIEQSMRETGFGTTQSFLRQLIAEIRPIGVPDENSRDAAMLTGTGGKLSFVSSHAVAAQYGGLYVSTLELVPSSDDGGETSDLVVRQRMLRPGEQKPVVDMTEPARSLLVKNVAGLSIRYFGRRANQGPEEWSETWPNRAKLPRLISIDLSFTENDRRIWPKLIVEVMFAER